MNKIDISIVMPVFNTDKFILKAAVDSILNQTFETFEFIIIDDHSDIHVKDIIDTVDSRIVIIRNDKNLGVAGSLNKGIDISRGKYIARMDSDDIADINRFKFQYEYLENHSDIGVVSSWALRFGASNRIIKNNTPDDMLKIECMFRNPIIHPTVMIRKKLLVNNNIYYNNVCSEDYDLWVRLLFEYDIKFHVINKPLLKYRIHKNQLTITNIDNILKSDSYIIKRILSYYDIELSDCEFDTFMLVRGNKLFKFNYLNDIKSVFDKILYKVTDKNERRFIYMFYFKYLIKLFVKNFIWCLHLGK